MSVAEAGNDAAARIRAALAAKPDGVLETVARAENVALAEVFAELPPGEATHIPASRFDETWKTLASWGEILFIVHTKDIVLEVEGSLPEGSHGHGYFNIHGDSPIGGHIRAENCASIWLIDRNFHGRRSCSVQFVNREGDAMFKVFVRRDEARNLRADQLERFEALKAQAQAA